MNAVNIEGKGNGGKRSVLRDILPLDTPLAIYVFPIYACNIQCNYCTFSLPPEKRGFHFRENIMQLSTFQSLIDGLQTFPQNIKTLKLVGVGEPLLHKHIAEMVKYSVDSRKVNTVEIITNGTLLTPDLSDKLISAGLDSLYISVQGTKRSQYEKVCRYPIDYSRFLTNIKYFYTHKTKTKVYIKIVDSALDCPEDKQTFYELFGDICDTIAVEKLVPVNTQIDYNKIKEDSFSTTKNGLSLSSENHICPIPFYMLQVLPDGDVVPCRFCDATYPDPIGNCCQESIQSIWMGKHLKEFQWKMLQGIGTASPKCLKCKAYQYMSFPEDRITKEDARKLSNFYRTSL